MGPIGFEVGTYYQLRGQWNGRPLGSLPIEGLDHVCYAFESIDEQGNIVLNTRGDDKKNFADLKKLEGQNPSLKASLAFGGRTGNAAVGFRHMLENPERMNHFIASLQSMSEDPANPRFGLFSEVTLNWTPVDKKWAAAFAELCRQIRKKTKLDIRATLPSGIEDLDEMEISSFDECISAYDLMAYDYHAPKDGRPTNFHAILSDREGPCIEKTLGHLAINRKKVNLGLPAFGMIYKNVPPGAEGNGYGEPCVGAQLDDPNFSYRDIENYVLAHPTAKIYHTALDGVLQSFIYNPGNGDWISFDDPDTLSGKVQWANEKGLHGVFLWSCDQDDPSFSELNAVRKAWTKI